MSISKKYSHKITCDRYEANDGGTRCRHYGTGGVCKLEDMFMCSEWEKLNRSKKLKDSSENEDISLTIPSKDVPEKERPRVVIARKGENLEPYVIPESDIKNLEELGMEVILTSEDFEGPMHVVKSYTGEDRLELTWRDLATLTTMVSVFPGSKVVKVLKGSGK